MRVATAENVSACPQGPKPSDTSRAKRARIAQPACFSEAL
jgi:hypothetical protein